jgi:hypoxanthine phosphoribosyltransferase
MPSRLRNQSQQQLWFIAGRIFIQPFLSACSRKARKAGPSRGFGSRFFNHTPRPGLQKNPLPTFAPPLNSCGNVRGTRKIKRPKGQDWQENVDRVLITEERIARRVQQLARKIERDFAGRDLVVVALLNGTIMFLADLVRHLSLPMRLDFIGVSSYREGTTAGQLEFTKQLRIDVRQRDVLVVDDILDTGQTIKRVCAELRRHKPRRMRICVLLEKKARRVEKVKADYIGFSIPDLFVVGYGLDYAERYRNLPFVGVMKAGATKAASG